MYGDDAADSGPDQGSTTVGVSRTTKARINRYALAYQRRTGDYMSQGSVVTKAMDRLEADEPELAEIADRGEDAP